MNTNLVRKCEICNEPYNDWRNDNQPVCHDCRAKANAKDNKKVFTENAS